MILQSVSPFSSSYTLTQTTARIGEEKIAASISDHAASCAAARRETTSAVETILNLRDACHNLHNIIKAITKLPEFKWVSLSSTVSMFCLDDETSLV